MYGRHRSPSESSENGVSLANPALYPPPQRCVSFPPAPCISVLRLGCRPFLGSRRPPQYSRSEWLKALSLLWASWSLMSFKFAAYFAGSLTLLLSHASPSKMPSPVVAQLGSTFQTWFLAIRSSSIMSETSFGDIAIDHCQPSVPSRVLASKTWQVVSCRRASSNGNVPPLMSCLLANTSNSASFISRSWIMRCSSFLASSILSRSLLSITKIRP